MYEELLRQVEAAVLRRNPGLAAGFRAGLAPEVVRKELKKVGTTEGIEPLVALYSWHDGANGAMAKEASNLGFAPPVVSGPDAKGLAYLQSLGHKVDANMKVYSSFVFHHLDMGMIKLWRKFAHQNKTFALLLGRYFPFMLKTPPDGVGLAMEVGPEGKGRVVTLGKDLEVRVAYESFEEFMRDVIRANERNEQLAFVGKEGELVELTVPLVQVVRKEKPKNAAVPVGENWFVLRTDFSDEAKWEEVCAALRKGGENGELPLDFVSDSKFEGVTAKKLVKMVPEEFAQMHGVGVIVDGRAMGDAERAVLVVDLRDEPGRAFRVAAGAIGLVYDNLSIGNMDFEEFVEAAGKGGVFRGFEEG